MSTKKKKTTPVMRQFKEIKAQHPDALLFFRMGDFYEMFFEDAVVASRDMEVALTSRDRNSDNPIPMCGVPFHAADSYIARLIKKGHRVAICDQVEDPRAAKGLVKRAVTRVVTPGTVTDDCLLEARENNFICAVVRQPRGATGAAFLDVSTGRFLLTESEDEDPLEFLRRELARYRPRELVHPEPEEPPSEADQELLKLVNTAVEELANDGRPLFSPLPGWAFGEETARSALTDQLKVASLEGYGCEMRTLAIRAAGGLLHYLRETQGPALGHIDSMSYAAVDRFMTLDPATVRNLELLTTAEGGRDGSLVSVLDLTFTGMGGRKLRDWFLRPLLDAGAIRERQEGVSELLAESIARDRLGGLLRQVLDLERLLGRVVLGTAGPRDLVALKSSLGLLPDLHGALAERESSILAGLHRELDLLENVHELLDRAINPEPPATIRDPGMIRDGYSPELDQLRAVARDGKQTIAGIEARERERTGITSLKVKYNRVFGYFIEISKANLGAVPEDYERKQTMVGSERFITPELKKFEELVVGAEEKMSDLEQELFTDIRRRTAAEAGRIKGSADRVATLDVLLALAETADRNRYCRPEITEGTRLRINAGRHPVIEQLSPTGERFVPNDLLLDDRENQILIITGPNMGGKSTFLRQVALITLMAHTGSFVPAEAAEIPLVDRIFTRVGASDSLVRGHSTFMVEMIETANILNNATPRSLVILDEVGRGTSTFDGVSIAWAVVEHLHNSERLAAKSLFATHFYELTELAVALPRVRNFNISVKEWNDEIIFLREVVEGAADRSYGVQVARLAGLPPAVLQRAREILANLEDNAFDRRGMPKLAEDRQTAATPADGQMRLFSPGEDPLLAEVRTLELDRMTPLDALTYLTDLQRKLK